MPHVDMRDFEKAHRYGRIVDDEGLVLYIPMTEGEGTTAKNKSKYGGLNNGTIHGAAWVDTPWRKGLYFDGIDDYVDCGNNENLNISGDMTLCAWVFSRTYSESQQPIVGKGDHQYMLRLDNTDNFNIFTYDGAWHTNAQSNLNASLNTWQFVCGRLLGTEISIWVDGIKQSATDTGGITTSAFNVNIGRNSEETNRFFDGIIDEVLIYNRALNLEEKRHYEHVPKLAITEWYRNKADAIKAIVSG